MTTNERILALIADSERCCQKLSREGSYDITLLSNMIANVTLALSLYLSETNERISKVEQVIEVKFNN